MAQYFMQINGQQMGPMDESVLLLNGLTPTTPVWTEGLVTWVPANQVPALAHLFANQAPPYQAPPPYGDAYQPERNHRVPKPPTNLVWGILCTVFCCLPFGIVSIVKASQVSSLYYQGKYLEAEEASKSAGKWALWSAVSVIIFYGLAVIAFVLGDLLRLD